MNGPNPVVIVLAGLLATLLALVFGAMLLYLGYWVVGSLFILLPIAFWVGEAINILRQFGKF